MESVFDRLRGNNEEGGKISQGISDFLYDVKEHKATRSEEHTSELQSPQ